ncbi:MAG: branched-chain amino acid ABC transporter permease, partial [Lachnospiraceae bacterium]|nr:branched-chain amino acid ABC transporter permease [Lachnospiraceae bacterium]
MKTGRISKTTRNDLITYAMVILAYIVMQLLVSTGHVSSLIQGLLVPFCTYAIVAIALNLTVGILGELSLGHAGFMCVGAFSSAVFSLAFKDAIPSGLRFFIALLIGAVAAALVGFLVGIPVLRLRGDYLAIVTLAFGEIIKNIINALYLGVDANGIHFTMKDALSLNMEEDGVVLIKGAQGVTGTPNDSNFTVGVILVLVTLFIVLNFIRSRTGRAVMSIRDNRIAAESVGINVTKYKLI